MLCKDCIHYNLCLDKKVNSVLCGTENCVCGVENKCNYFVAGDKVKAVWEVVEHEDGYEHHYCSNCQKQANFIYEYEPIYDETLDGDMVCLGSIVADIHEFLTKFCGNCGAEMQNYK